MGSQALKFPFEFRPLQPEETETLKKNFSAAFEYIHVGPGGYLLSADYEKHAENIYNLQIKSDDVVVYSFPRSGTTWTQELVWLICKDLDYEAAAASSLTARYTFLEFASLFSKRVIENLMEVNESQGIQLDVNFLSQLAKPGSEVFSSCPSPRFIKTHLPLSFLPPTTIDTAKVVYVARDPRDTAVSYYHQNKLFKYVNYQGDFKNYWNLFMNNLLLWTPYFEHLKEAWALRDHPNMLFLFYEELSKDLPATVRRVANFFGKQYSEEQIARLSDHLNIKNFKKNSSVNASEFEGLTATDESFVRKGKAGGWREYFDEEMSRQAEAWIADNLRDTDLQFPHLS